MLAACEARTPAADPGADSLADSIAAPPVGDGTGGPADDTLAALARVRARLPQDLLVRRGACPFECCTYREWTAESDIPVLASARDRGRPAFTIPAGQRFAADSGNVWITGVLLVVVTDSVADRPYWSFAPGDTLVVLDHVGEGYFNVWDGTEVRAVEGFWEPWRERAAAHTFGEHRAEWWVHVTLPDGRQGWFEASSDVRLTGADSCG